MSNPETFLGVPTWLVHFSWNPKLHRNECKGIHILVPSHMTLFQSHHVSLRGIPWCSKLGPRESLKARIITFNFYGFFWHFWTSLGLVIFFSPNIRMSANATYNLAHVFDTIWIASKCLWIAHLFIYHETKNYLVMNVKASTYWFQATWIFSNDLPCPSEASCGVRSSDTGKVWKSVLFLEGILCHLDFGPWESTKVCIITFNFGCFWGILGLIRARLYFSPGTFVGVSLSLVTLVGCLGLRFSKSLKHPICSFLMKPKIASK